MASKLVTFAAFAYLARVAGPGGFGNLEFAASVLFFASLVVEQGFGPYGAREIARAPHRTAELVSEIVLARILLAAAAYAAMIGVALALDRDPVSRLIVIYGASLLAMPLLLQWVFQGHDRMRVVAASQVIRQATFAVVVFVFVRAASQLWIAAAAEVAAVTAAAVFGVVMYRRGLGAGTIAPARLSARLFREGVPIGLSQMFWVARIFGGTLILGVIASPRDVGFFAGALRILVAAHTFVWLYYFNLLPSLSRSWQSDRPAFAALVERSYRLVAWMALAGALVWILLARPVMTTVYGAEFAPGTVPLQLMAVVCALAALSGHYRFGLIAAGRQNAEMWVSVLGAVVAAVVIPIGYLRMGIAGAAAGLLVAEIAVWLSAWWCGRRMLALHGHARLLLPPTVATAAISALVWLGLSRS